MAGNLQQLARDLAGPIFPYIARRLAANKGTTFPTGIAAGDTFFRTDLMMWCVYDGTRWLTAHEYTAGIYLQATGANSVAVHELRQDYAPYVMRVAIGYQVITTNNGTNYWTIAVSSVNAAYSASTSLRSITTAAVAANSWNNSDAAVGLAPADRARFQIVLTQTMLPGLITAIATITYRLIIT